MTDRTSTGTQSVDTLQKSDRLSGLQMTQSGYREHFDSKNTCVRALFVDYRSALETWIIQRKVVIQVRNKGFLTAPASSPASWLVFGVSDR